MVARTWQRLATLIFGFALIGTACGGSHKSIFASSGSEVDMTEAAALYEQFAADSRSAGNTYNDLASTYKSRSTHNAGETAELDAALRTALSELRRFRDRVNATDWPSSAKGEAKEAVQAIDDYLHDVSTAEFASTDGFERAEKQSAKASEALGNFKRALGIHS